MHLNEISRKRAERWLEQNAPPPDVEIAIVDPGKDPPFPVAPQDRYTVKEVPPSDDLANLLALAKQGQQSEWPLVERQAWNVVQAVHDHQTGDGYASVIPPMAVPR